MEQYDLLVQHGCPMAGLKWGCSGDPHHALETPFIVLPLASMHTTAAPLHSERAVKPTVGRWV